METLRMRVDSLASWAGYPMRWPQTWLARDSVGKSDSESGQGLAEYALILALIAIVAISALALLGVNLNAVFLDPVAADIGDVLSSIVP